MRRYKNRGISGECAWGVDDLGWKSLTNQGVAERVVCIENGNVWRWEDATGGGNMLEVTEMSKNADWWVKGKGQGITRRAELWKTEET